MQGLGNISNGRRLAQRHALQAELDEVCKRKHVRFIYMPSKLSCSGGDVSGWLIRMELILANSLGSMQAENKARAIWVSFCFSQFFFKSCVKPVKQFRFARLLRDKNRF